ncbi:MAG TPA: DUF6036 family nucleotidyltransferase [Pyrinomonadaceae bacterium]
MRADEIKQYLKELDDELRSMDVKGEVCLYGGAVMCLVYNARPSTKDIDAIFQPAGQLRIAAERIAQAHNLRSDWLNDGVKGFVVPHSQRILFDFPNLKVYIPEPDYLLAMKAIAARFDTTDRDDVKLLIKLLGIKTAVEVFVVLEKYYPRQQIKPATQFFIEELFER